ncbi:hypothetical protein Tco_1111939 [Tanacetum coccineum]|uniref:Uncharacterized protein n=1 Tax=Tanacetum coccineum TaxID=301880 RepID=A0ABQ5IN23_9ASTR
METKNKLDLDKNGILVDAMKYRSMIGALMYLTSNRPNIVHATCLCARYHANATRSCKVTFKRTSWTQFLGEKLVGWSSKKQDCTALSTAEAEYVSLSDLLCLSHLDADTENYFSILNDDEADNTKPPLFADTFGNNDGDDSETLGPVTPAEEVADSGHSSTLSSLVKHKSLRVLQLWERIVIRDVHGLMDNEGIHNFVQPNAGGGDASISYGDGLAVPGVRVSPEEATIQTFNAENGNDESNQIVQRVPRTESTPGKAMFNVITATKKTIMLVIVRNQEFVMQTDGNSEIVSSYDAKAVSEVNVSSKVHDQISHAKHKTIIHTSDDDQIDSNIIFDDPFVENNDSLHSIDVENYAEAMTHPKPALHPIDVENYDASLNIILISSDDENDDEDEAEKDVAVSYRIE